MSISPSSDIVLDVARAADPAKYREAAQRLARAAADRLGEDAALMTGATEKALKESVAEAAVTKRPAAPDTLSLTKSEAAFERTKVKDPYEDFEAFFLQTVVESMLPKDAKSLFGSGPGAKVWKSMLAEHMARELASGTAFGIAEQIAEHREQKGARATGSAVQPAHDAENAASGQSGQLADFRRILAAEGERSAHGTTEAVKPGTESG